MRRPSGGRACRPARNYSSGCSWDRGVAAADDQREFSSRRMLLEVLQRGLRGASKDLFEALGQLATDRHWPIGTEASHQVLERGDDAVRRLEHDQGLIAAGMPGKELAARGSG